MTISIIAVFSVLHYIISLPNTGRGTFIYNGGVEDSATAEISRSQIWQWIRHRICLEGEETVVSRQLIETIISDEVIMKLNQQYTDSSLLTTSVQVSPASVCTSLHSRDPDLCTRLVWTNDRCYRYYWSW